MFNDSGDIVCRSTLTDAGNGCVPLNRFGVGVGSEEGIDFVMVDRVESNDLSKVTAANLVFNDLEGWAGPIGFAMGAEYREESIKGKVDPKYKSGWNTETTK